MQLFIYLTFIAVFSLDFLHRYGIIPRQVTWLPELLSIGAFIAVVFVVTKKKDVEIGLGYWIIFAFMTLHLTSGVVLNEVSSPVLISGLRTYLKYIPFFFIPVVFAFSGGDIKKQLNLLLILTLVQFPIAIYQRFVESAGLRTGDIVRGTLNTSSLLSVYLLSAFAILLAFYLKKKISLKVFALLALIFLIPTTLNETKGTVLLLPFAVLLPAFFSDMGKRRLRSMTSAIAVGGLFLMIFSFSYNHFYGSHYTLAGFYTDEAKLQKKLAPKASGISEEEGRLDVIIAPFKEFSDEPFKLLYGLGIGNVGESFLGANYSGAYNEQYGDKMYLAFANIIWETGVLGAILIMLLWAKISSDAIWLRKQTGITSIIALGWIGVMGVLFVSLFYKNIINQNAIGYLFWYFAGLMASERVRLGHLALYGKQQPDADLYTPSNPKTSMATDK